MQLVMCQRFRTLVLSLIIIIIIIIIMISEEERVSVRLIAKERESNILTIDLDRNLQTDLESQTLMHTKVSYFELMGK